MFDPTFARHFFRVFGESTANSTNYWEQDHRLYVRKNPENFHHLIAQNVSVKPFSDPSDLTPLFQVKVKDDQGKTVLMMLKQSKGHFLVTSFLTGGPDYKGFVPQKDFQKIKAKLNAVIQAENQFITGKGMQLADDYETIGDTLLVEVTDPRFSTIEALRTEARKYFTEDYIQKRQLFEGDPHLYEEHQGKVYRGVSGEPWEPEKIENAQAVSLQDGSLMVCFPFPHEFTYCYRFHQEDGHWKLVPEDENLDLYIYPHEDGNE